MPEDRTPPIFCADSPGLDFLNSIAVPVDHQVEWLGTGADFLDWLTQTELAPEEALEVFARTALPGELDAVAAQARALREWFRNFVLQHKGKPLKPSALHDLEPLNRILARDEEFGQIIARDKRDRTHRPKNSLTWRIERRWRSPDAFLLPIARAMADLICQEDFTHVKACEGPTCTLLFVDRTRRRSRRWCSMAVCGNRAKQAAYRERSVVVRKR